MRPGRAPASSTSKPVIVGHKPVVKDSSVTVNGVGERRSLMDSTKKVALKPLVPAPAAPSPNPAAPEIPAAAATTSSPAPSSTPPGSTPPGPTDQAAPQAEPASVLTPPAPLPTPSVPSAPAASTPAPALPPAAKAEPAAAVSAATLNAPAKPDHAPASVDDLLDSLPPDLAVGQHDDEVVSRKVGPGEFPLKTVLLVSIIVLLALSLLNILLDADFIGWGIPHTDFL